MNDLEKAIELIEKQQPKKRKLRGGINRGLPYTPNRTSRIGWWLNQPRRLHIPLPVNPCLPYPATVICSSTSHPCHLGISSIQRDSAFCSIDLPKRAICPKKIPPVCVESPGCTVFCINKQARQYSTTTPASAGVFFTLGNIQRGYPAPVRPL